MKIKRGVMLIASLAVVFICLVMSAYFLYTYIGKCDTQECFYNSLVKCQRSSYINDGANTILSYKILGKSDDKCKVNVELLQVKRGSAELAALEKENMDCYVQIGVLAAPETNLNECHGILKEDIQDMIIKRMHAQIIENIGKISEEITKIL